MNILHTQSTQLGSMILEVVDYYKRDRHKLYLIQDTDGKT